MRETLPIGIFDSGVGGLTVMREVARLLPHENLLYLGDTARVPYGTRSPEAILKYTLEGAAFLLEKKIKLLIIACHTACSHSLEVLQKQCPIPVIGVTQSGLDVLKNTPWRRIAVLGTSSTIRSGTYQTIFKTHFPEAEGIFIACPLFVPLIEEGLLDHPATTSIANHYLGKVREVDAALLACTHYPLIRPIIQQAIGEHVTIIEPAHATAHMALQSLTNTGLLNTERKPHLQFFATDDPEKFAHLAHLFFGANVKKVLHTNLM